jgi:protein-disulfide isomerase
MSSSYDPTIWEILTEDKKKFFSILSGILILILVVISIMWYNKIGFFSENTQSSTTLIRDYNFKKGPSDAKVSLVYFFDYECSHCQTFNPVLNTFNEEYKDKVQVVYKDLPIIGIYSKATSEAASAAKLQGKYLEFKNSAIEKNQNGQKMTTENLEVVAKELELDIEKWQKDRVSLVIKDQVKQDETDWKSVKVPKSSYTQDSRPNGTPTVIIMENNEIKDWWTGQLPTEELKIRVDKYLQ